MCFRFDTMSALDRQTVGRTDETGKAVTRFACKACYNRAIKIELDLN